MASPPKTPPEQQTTRRQLIVATLGHVDHGKTRLVHALTGIDTDRLPDEKRRGISIELGYARLASAPVSFIDVPGHKKLVHTMISGMGGVDVGLLVVAADDAVMPQTLEHLQVCRLSAIDCVVVALTKTDSVDEETLQLATLDVEVTLAGLGIKPLATLHTDAISGRGVDELRQLLVARQRSLAEAEARPAATATDQRAWLAIDRVFSVRGSGKVVTGTLIRGVLIAGSDLWLMQEDATHRVTCRSLQVHDQQVDRVSAPSRVAVNLTHLPPTPVARGQALVDNPDEAAVRRIDAHLRVLPSAVEELRSGGSVLCHIGSGYRAARLTWLAKPEPASSASGEAQQAALEGFAHLALESAIPAQSGVGIILRGFRRAKDRGAVLGGGQALDVCPGRLPRRGERSPSGQTRWQARADALRALAAERNGPNLGRGAERVLETCAPRPLGQAELTRRFGISAEQLKRASEAKSSTLLCVGSEQWTIKPSIALVEAELHACVAAHHRLAPHEAGLPSETALAELTRRSCRALAERCLNRALRDGTLLLSAGRLSTPSFTSETSGAQGAVQASLLDALLRAGLQGMRLNELLESVGASAALPELRVALAALSQRSSALQLDGIWFHEAALEALRRGVADHFARETSLKIGDLKQRFGVSRKQAVPLLEQLDREGVTRRVGSERVAGAKR